MIDIKTKNEIAIMREGGKKLKKVVNALLKQIEVGMTTKSIDLLAEKMIRDEGGESSFKKVENYYWTTCLTINEQVVHTPPSDRKLKLGDILTVDIGVYYKGYHTDFATTFSVGKEPDSDTKRFLETGKQALIKAIRQAKAGNHLGHISKAIQQEIEGNGYFIMRDLTGHGIGKTLHEDPYVFGYLDRPIEKTLLIKPGLTIAVEVIYSKGTEEISHEKNNEWSIISKDRSLTACFEHTIAITEKETLVLT